MKKYICRVRGWTLDKGKLVMDKSISKDVTCKSRKDASEYAVRQNAALQNDDGFPSQYVRFSIMSVEIDTDNPGVGLVINACRFDIFNRKEAMWEVVSDDGEYGQWIEGVDEDFRYVDRPLMVKTIKRLREEGAK